MSHPDGCPACCEGIAEPLFIETTGPGRTTERYECPSCGYEWTTTWDEGTWSA